MFRYLTIAAVLGFLVVASCGGAETIYPTDVPTDSPPFIARTDPTSGTSGDQITIYGFGFSAAPNVNIIIVGDAATSATDYELLANPTATEIESITFDVPAGAQVGTQTILVMVYDNPSNADVTFTVNP